MAINEHCQLCPDEHTLVCDCGHDHQDHVFAGGCKIIKCICTGYSQKLQRKPKAYNREFKECFVRVTNYGI